MTHTTTDAAEARALTVIQDDRDAAAAIWQSFKRAFWKNADDFPGVDEIGGALAVPHLTRHRLATAEAASGAGERGCRDPHSKVAWLTDAASLPPATDPAMALDPTTVEQWRAIIEVVANADSEDAIGSLDVDIPDGRYPRQWLRTAARAALAAAPTIPATGEAVPAGMKPWHGEDGPPNDWDGGEVLLENGQMGDGNVWDHHPSRSPGRIIAYTPKATIPATGHAATETDDEARVDAWNEFAGDHLTDGKGHAAADVRYRCRAAFERAWSKGREAANAAAFAVIAQPKSAGHAATEGEG